MRAHFRLGLGAERGSVPVHAVALAAVLWAMFAARTFTVRLLSIVTCALQFTLMFWRPESRFGLLAWLMTVVTIIALSGEGLPTKDAPSAARSWRERRLFLPESFIERHDERTHSVMATAHTCS